MKVPTFIIGAGLSLAAALLLWQLSIIREIDQRLARMEAKVEMLAGTQHATK